MVKNKFLPSFGSLRVPKLQIFLEMFCANLQSPVWICHVGEAHFFTKMTAAKQSLLTLATDDIGD